MLKGTLLISTLTLAALAFDASPAVGVLMLPSEFGAFPYESNYAMAEVVKWVTQHGMRWFPVYITDSTQMLRQKILEADLILLTGGDVEIYDPKHYPAQKKLTRYAKAVKYIVETAKSLNKQGIHKPIYGICLGYQALTLAMSEFDLFFNDDFANVRQQQKVDFDIEKNSLFRTVFSDLELKSFGETAYFWHSYNHGFTLENAQKSVKFNENMEILSTSVTLKGVRVVSAVKAKHFPFYGTLFHPEHAQFSVSDSDPFEWSNDALRYNWRIGTLLRSLIGTVKSVKDNATLVKYRKHLRYNFDFEQTEILTLIDVPIHAKND